MQLSKAKFLMENRVKQFQLTVHPQYVSVYSKKKAALIQIAGRSCLSSVRIFSSITSNVTLKSRQSNVPNECCQLGTRNFCIQSDIRAFLPHYETH